MSSQSATLSRDVSITRRLSAPRALVFRAWTDASHLAQWFGPSGFNICACEVDLKVGGALRIVMRAPDGSEHPMRGVFREIVAGERLVFTNIAVDANDKPLLEGLTTVTFEDEGEATRMTLTASMAGAAGVVDRMLEGMEAGWSQSLDKLAEFLLGT
jgi:uncharacterized protein YndB with AHSA1/START domain